MAFSANAQKRDTAHMRNLTNVDTLALTFKSVPSNVTSLQITAVVNSGTLTGTNKVYLKATDDGIGWQTIDSLVLDNSKAINTKLFPILKTYYNSYQAYFITQGTIVLAPWFTILYRPDENDDE